MDSISTRVWKSHRTILDWAGHNASADSRKLPGSVRSPEHNRWNNGTIPNIPVSRLANSSTNYTLTIGGWSGDTGFDAMAYHNGRQFTTYDADHDGWVGGNCASNSGGGGFWFGVCANAFISGDDLAWATSTGWMQLNVVEVSLSC